MDHMSSTNPVAGDLAPSTGMYKRPDSERIFALRRYVVGFFVVVVYVLLDRSTVFFQMWSDISAWYPPIGLSTAVLIGLGARYAPVLFLAGLVSAKLNYHTTTLSYNFLAGNAIIISAYTGAAIFMKRVLKMDWRLGSIRDVMSLLFVALPTSGMVAFLGTLMIVLDQAIPRNEYVQAALNWWVGDAVAIACLTPYCLVFLMPAVRRFVGITPSAKDVESGLPAKSNYEAQGRLRSVESAAIAVVILGSLWAVLGPNANNSHDMFYIFFVPIIWIAVRRGLRGATTGILIVDVGIVFSLRLNPGDPSHFAVLQFLMLILSVTGLVLGSLISERDRSESRLSREEERIRLLLRNSTPTLVLSMKTAASALTLGWTVMWSSRSPRKPFAMKLAGCCLRSAASKVFLWKIRQCESAVFGPAADSVVRSWDAESHFRPACIHNVKGVLLGCSFSRF